MHNNLIEALFRVFSGVKDRATRASRRFHQQVVSGLQNVLVMELVEKLSGQVEPFVARQLTSVINPKGRRRERITYRIFCKAIRVDVISGSPLI